MKKRKVLIESKKIVWDSFFKIEEATLRYERFDGQMSQTIRRLNLNRGDSVAALLLNTDSQKVLLTNQFKYPTFDKSSGWIVEVLAGMVEDGEEPEAALRREIEEEAGYTARDVEYISTFYVSPGGTSERIILYYAEVSDSDRTSSGGGLASENEDIETVEFSLPEAWAALESGEIMDAKTIIALMWLRNKMETEAKK